MSGGETHGATHLAGWRRLGASVGVILVIGAPTLILEEDWHGRPMLDQPGHLWLFPTLVVAAAFALGGVFAGRGLSDFGRAAAWGLLAGVASAGSFLAADGVRRAIHDQAVSTGVTRLWVEAALLSVTIATLGALTAPVIARTRR